MGGIGPDVHLPPSDWPKFLDPIGEHANVRPDPHSTTVQETWWLEKYAPTTPSDLYAAIVDHLAQNIAAGARAEGMDAVYAAADELRKEAAARGKKADDEINTFAAGASFLAGPEYGAAIELAWQGFKALGKLLYGGPVDTPEDIQRLSDTYKASMQEGYPPTWGIFGEALTGSAGQLADRMQVVLSQFRTLPGPDRTAVRKAWSLMVLHSKDPPIEDVFNGLGWRDGFASEVQVFYLARTLAVVHGLDEHDLFVRLYNTAGDWRSRPDILTASPDGGDMAFPGLVKVDNAGVVQWVTVSQAAFALVEGASTGGGTTFVRPDLGGGALGNVRDLQPSTSSSGSAVGWIAGGTALAAIVGGLYYARHVRGWEF
ncbi:MAG: hypothetical protein NVS3B10_18290 [Polyangiales bacterium]